MVDMKERIARRVARELNDGDVVNLGIGLPTMVAECLPEGVDIILQSENGIMGMGSKPILPDEDVINAGAQYVSILPGGQYFDRSGNQELFSGTDPAGSPKPGKLEARGLPGGGRGRICGRYLIRRGGRYPGGGGADEKMGAA